MTIGRRGPLLAFVAGLFILAAPPHVQAGSGSYAAPSVSRQVGPHCFSGAVSYPNPFLSTYVRSSTGLGSTTEFEATIYDVGSQPRVVKEMDVTLQYLLLGLEYQERVSHAVAVRGAVSGAGRMGILDTAALLTDGVKVDVDCSVGATVALWERSRFKLSGSLDAAGKYFGDVLIRNYVEDVVAHGIGDSTNSIWEDATSLRATTGVRAAYGHSKTVGYLIYGDIGVQSRFFEEDAEAVWDTGVVLSLDLQEHWGPDLGVAMSAMYRSPELIDPYTKTSRWDADLGIFYTARPELTLGVEIGYTPLRKSSLDEWYGMITMNILLRYDFS